MMYTTAPLLKLAAICLLALASLVKASAQSFDLHPEEIAAAHAALLSSPDSPDSPDSLAEARFFNAFPERGEDLTLLYETHDLTAGTTLDLSDSSNSHISAFWNLRLIPAEVLAEKAVAITCGLRINRSVSCYWQWHLRQALAQPDWRDVIVDEVARLRNGHQLEFWAMVWSSAEADSRDLLFESLRPSLLTRHPHTVGISDRAFHLFHNGVRSRGMSKQQISLFRKYAQSDTVAEQIRNFYVRYMETLETGSLKEANGIGRSFLTPEMQEKNGRLIAATGSDPLLRAQDVSDYGRNSLQCKHLEGDWYEVSYRWAESDTTGIHIPVRIKKDAKGNVRIAYITPDWAEDKYSDHIFDIPNPKVNDKKDGRTFVETFFRAYVYPYVKMSSTLEQELEQLRQTYCTPAMLEKYATMLRESWEEEGPIDPMIGCADFDAFWYRSLKVTSEGKDRYAVNYSTGAQDWNIRLTVTVTRDNGKLRICDIETE